MCVRTGGILNGRTLPWSRKSISRLDWQGGMEVREIDSPDTMTRMAAIYKKMAMFLI